MCVQQTALDFLEEDYDVHVIADATSSRTMTERLMALERMKQSGAFITTSESILFMLLKDAKHEQDRFTCRNESTALLRQVNLSCLCC